MPRRSRSDNSARRVIALPQASLRQALSKRFQGCNALRLIRAEGETLPRTSDCTVEIVQPAKHDTKITEALAVSGSKSQASSKAVAASRNRP